MLDLVLAVCCSLAIAMIFKHAGRRRLDRLTLLTVNYAAALALAVGLLAVSGRGLGAFGGGPLLLMLGGVTGALFIGTFFLYALATEVAGLSLAVGVMRVSVVIPVMASWWVWGEVPSGPQALGLALATGSFLLIARPSRGEAEGVSRRAFVLLALVFCAGGLVDVLMKTFDEGFATTTSQAAFLLLVYGVACGLGAVLVGVRWGRSGRLPGGAVLAWGVVLGLVNYGSTAFFLRAIRQLAGPFVFPANNLAIVLGGALLGVFVWGERLSRASRLGLALAALALVLLGL